jgi:hypothetical protein
MIPLSDRITIIVGHAEALADEAADAGLFHVTDRLRLAASRLAIDKELVDAALLAAARTRVVRAEKLVHLRAFNHRIEVEMAHRYSADEAAAFLTAARVSPTSTARFRLRRLGPEQEAAIQPLVAGLRTALENVEAADDDHLSAVAAEFIARARCNGRAEKLRVDLERAKAELLAMLPPDSPSAVRVRRRVVRTRRPVARPSWRPDSTIEGEAVE